MTSTTDPAHSDRVQALLKGIEAERTEILNLGMRVMGNPGSNIYTLDFFMLGAVKRHLSTSAAFCLMVTTWNLVCARALLRMHIDTALRFSAVWLVEDPNDFASKVLGGERIDRLTDREGNRLTDAHLVKVRTDDYPWLPGVYRNLSGYVHFSSAHIFDSVASLDDASRKVNFELSEKDTKFPEFSWLEVADCFREATKMLATFLTAYSLSKHGTAVIPERNNDEGS